MARINTNIPSQIARANLAKSDRDLDIRLQRLSTGLRINRGADDPAGLIVTQRLGSEINGLEQAVKNSERASSVISTAEGALNEVSDLLNSIKALVVEASNTGAISEDERRANQLQIDSAIDTITRIANATSFGGLKLLNGALDYVLSGLDSASISKAQVFGANFANQASIQVQVDTVASAQTGSLFLRGDYSTALGNGVFQSSVTFEVAGPRGVQVFTVLSGRPFSEVTAAINSFRDATGVSASLVNGNANSGVVFNSIDFGSQAFASVQRIGGPADLGFFKTYKIDNNASVPASVDIPTLITAGTLVQSNRDTGRDVVAVVNGSLASGRGLKVSLPNTNSLAVDLLLERSFATVNGSTTTFSITGGGALYQLGGDVNSSQQINIGLPSIAASRLGGTLVNGTLNFLSSIRSGGANALSTSRFEEASKVLGGAIDEISLLRGRLGALEKNTLDTNARAIQTAIENLTSSQSRIRDADFASESSALTRAQILASAGTSTLALANQRSQQVLSLLRG